MVDASPAHTVSTQARITGFRMDCSYETTSSFLLLYVPHLWLSHYGSWNYAIQPCHHLLRITIATSKCCYTDDTVKVIECRDFGSQWNRSRDVREEKRKKLVTTDIEKRDVEYGGKSSSQFSIVRQWEKSGTRVV